MNYCCQGMTQKNGNSIIYLIIWGFHLNLYPELNLWKHGWIKSKWQNDKNR